MNKIAERTVNLDKGCVGVYTENGVTLYIYKSCDPIDDEVFAMAKAGRGVVLELPGFYDNIRYGDFKSERNCGVVKVGCVSCGRRERYSGVSGIRSIVLCGIQHRGRRRGGNEGEGNENVSGL